jgi:hypothetical protein
VRDGGRFGITVKCFGGCSRGQVFAAINAKLGTQFGLEKTAQECFGEIDPDASSRKEVPANISVMQVPHLRRSATLSRGNQPPPTRRRAVAIVVIWDCPAGKR